MHATLPRLNELDFPALNRRQLETLQVNLGAPTGGSSSGDVTLSTTAADLVTGITQRAESGLTVSYTLSATVAAGVVASDTRTVTLTLTAGS